MAKIKGLDEYGKLNTASLQAIKAAGNDWLGLYLSNGVGTIHAALTGAVIKLVHSMGMGVVFIAELGSPTSASYFSVNRATANVARIIELFKFCGAPSGSEVYSTIDYDANVSDVQAYIIAMHNGLKAAGYLHSIYANGTVCEWAFTNGYAHHTWLAEGDRMSGYTGWKDKANILQIETTKIAGLDVDMDVVKTPDYGAWAA